MNCLNFSVGCSFVIQCFPGLYLLTLILHYFNIITSKAEQKPKSTTAVHSKVKELVVLSAADMFKTSVQQTTY